MPELPEVEALARFLDGRTRGRTIDAADVGAVAALKTYDPPLSALVGRSVHGWSRRGKWLVLATDGPSLAVHLARGGWVRWREQAPTTPVRPRLGGGSRGASLTLRLRFDDGAGADVTEAGTRRRVAVHVVEDAEAVEAIRTLGVEPLSEDFTADVLGELLRARNQQVKGLLRDQRAIAGIGNAYSDEILHTAQVSPFALTRSFDDDAVDALHRAVVDTLTAAVAAAEGRPAAELKDAKRRGMQVHGRTGQTCPVCGDVVREVSFADRSLQYCATCQTGGHVLADRRMSRLLR
ncbi:Fpg/Nei family DNA glycosylase [Isoptericola sediminis]|uniref:Fpg/Nei family DNA glycosylase n=1 Tax=Isoptericola sediminis TaxID=2733572 RepID=A0A849JTP5_9MICO|nr:Fpg/Nei family DNA glycosylase [Isoptericola sediminis]NNU26766.1 Fpg/Nei family DNA glycosylase [Isoptericola sediminis]